MNQIKDQKQNGARRGSDNNLPNKLNSKKSLANVCGIVNMKEMRADTLTPVPATMVQHDRSLPNSVITDHNEQAAAIKKSIQNVKIAFQVPCASYYTEITNLTKRTQNGIDYSLIKSRRYVPSKRSPQINRTSKAQSKLTLPRIEYCKTSENEPSTYANLTTVSTTPDYKIKKAFGSVKIKVDDQSRLYTINQSPGTLEEFRVKYGLTTKNIKSKELVCFSFNDLYFNQVN